jgi:hypothetical protein
MFYTIVVKILFTCDAHLRKTRQNRLQLLNNLLLNRRIIDRRLIVCISRADGNIAVLSSEQDDIRLPRQTRAAAPVRVLATEDTSIDARENVLELAGVAAPAVLNLGEVDIEEGIVGQVGLSTVNDGCGDVQCEVSVDFAVQRSGCVPCGWVASLAGKRNSRDLLSLRGVGSGSNGSGEGRLNCDVATDVGSGKGKLGFGSVPELGCNLIDTVLDGSYLGINVNRNSYVVPMS